MKNISNQQLLEEIKLLKSKNKQLEDIISSGNNSFDKNADETIKQKLISSISSSFVGKINLDKEINNLLKTVGEYSNADRSYVFIFREDDKIMDNTHEWCAKDVTPEIDNLQNQASDIFQWWMSKLYKNEIVHIKDVSKLPKEATAERKILESQGIKSILEIPLNIFGKLIGFMGLDNNTKAKAWSTETINILKTSAEILANTLHSKKVEEELQISEKKYRSLTESMEDVVVRISPTGTILYVSPSAEKFGGYIPKEEIGNNISKYIFHKSDMVKALKSINDVMLNKKGGIFEYIFKAKNKPPFPVEHSFTPLIKDGKVYAIQLVLRNISERKKNENALKENQYRFKALSEATYEGILISRKGIIIDVNQALCDLTGYSYYDFVGSNATEFITPDYTEHVHQNMISGYDKPYKSIIIRKDGSQLHVEFQGKMFKYKGKDSRVTAARDITVRNKNETIINESKIKLEKLNSKLVSTVLEEVKKNREKDRIMMVQSKQAAMGEMIGNIAHQWRQPLNDIGLYIQNLQDKFEYNDLTEENLTEIVNRTMDELDYMSHTIDDFRNFFRSDKEKVQFLLSDNINRTILLTEASFKNSHIRVKLSLEENIFFNGYPNEFSQAILNILNNAKDILIENSTHSPHVHINLKEKGGIITLIISNNGGHIPTKIIDQIFDPYFTTKTNQTGTGLGLYISKTIIERNMDGKLSVRNANTNHAEFIIELFN